MVLLIREVQGRSRTKSWQETWFTNLSPGPKIWASLAKGGYGVFWHFDTRGGMNLDIFNGVYIRPPREHASISIFYFWKLILACFRHLESTSVHFLLRPLSQRKWKAQNHVLSTQNHDLEPTHPTKNRRIVFLEHVLYREKQRKHSCAQLINSEKHHTEHLSLSTSTWTSPSSQPSSQLS